MTWASTDRAKLRKFCNLILSNGLLLDGVPEALIPDLANIDEQRMSLHQFAHDTVIATLKHGDSFILVDYPPLNESIKSHQDFLLSGRRPCWIRYQAPDRSQG